MYKVDYQTERQGQILRCLREWVSAHGEPPTLAEIGEAVGLSSKSAVHYQLRRMEARGEVVRTGLRSRAYRPV